MKIQTKKRNEFVDITESVRAQVPKNFNGILTVFVPHTTAGVTINEHADPDVVIDMLATLDKLVPEDPGYQHAEGNSDSHVKASLMGSSVQIIVEEGNLLLGTWQGIFFCEFDGPRTRNVILHFLPK